MIIAKLLMTVWILLRSGDASQRAPYLPADTKVHPCHGVCQAGCFSNITFDRISSVLATVLEVAAVYEGTPTRCDPCAGGYSFYLADMGKIKTGSCYKTLKKPLSWEAARKECLKSGGDLVSLETKREIDHVIKSLKKNGIMHMGGVWAGGKFENDTWEWVATGEEFSFTYWAPGQPVPFTMFAENYLFLDPNSFRWYRGWQVTPAIGICEKKASCS